MRVLTATLIFIFSFCALSLSLQPQKIISLAPALTKQLYLLGVGDEVVGVTTYCQRPAEAQKKEKVGTVLKADVERIVSLQPELVLTSSLTSPQDKDKLKRLGIRVVDFPTPQAFTQLCAQFLELGRLVGKEQKAAQIVEQAGGQVERLKKKVSSFSRKRVFMQVGARPLFTVTADSFFNDYIEFAGGINIAAGAKSGFYSREMVLKDNPEVIIIAAMGIAGEQEKEVWKNFQTLDAVKFNQIYIVDDYQFCSPTPLEFVQALEEMVGILHPQDE